MTIFAEEIVFPAGGGQVENKIGKPAEDYKDGIRYGSQFAIRRRVH